MVLCGTAGECRVKAEKSHYSLVQTRRIASRVMFNLQTGWTPLELFIPWFSTQMDMAGLLSIRCKGICKTCHACTRPSSANTAHTLLKRVLIARHHRFSVLVQH